MSKGWRVPRQAVATVVCVLTGALALTGPQVAALADSQAESAASCPNSNFSGFSVALPDCRAYELVSPALGNQEVYSPLGIQGEAGILTELPFRASVNGDSMAFIADPPSSIEEGSGNTGGGGGNEWMATRGAGKGWEAGDITPGNISAEYKGFATDLSTTIVRSLDKSPRFPPLTSEVAELPSLANCEILYSRATGDGAYRALFTTTQSPNFCGEEGELAFVGESVDGSRTFFQTDAALIPGVEEVSGGYEYDLYESVDGRVSAVNVLDGKADPNATFGAPAVPAGVGVVADRRRIDSSNAISADGSRAYWTDLNTGIVYVREDGTKTVPVSVGPATFWTATPDGRYAYYVEGEQLWRFDVEGEAGHQREVIAGEGLAHENAGIQGVVGINESGEDGAYVYFVADGRLAGNENASKETAKLGSRNLYVHHENVTRYIATLSPEDGEFTLPGLESQRLGDWETSLANRTSEVSADGRSLAFISREPLTGYDNVYQQPESSPVHVMELFVYAAGTERLECASCDPTGAPPPGREGGATVFPSFNNTFMRRWFSEDGDRVFFDTAASLVPQGDTNHGYLDVYEWERNGAGSCPAVSADVAETGCIFLISSGSSVDSSFFVEASANGSDVFFTTRSTLVPQDQNGIVDLYDARVGGGFPEVSLSCTGTACQGTPPPQPIFATPSSVTFNGVGNFESSSGVTVRRKQVAKCKRGFAKKHGKCVKVKAKRRKAKAKRAAINGRGRS